MAVHGKLLDLAQVCECSEATNVDDLAFGIELSERYVPVGPHEPFGQVPEVDAVRDILPSLRLMRTSRGSTPFSSTLATPGTRVIGLTTRFSSRS